MEYVALAFVLLLAGFLVVCVSLALHELGHFIAGRLTGHKLVYLCVYGLCFYGKTITHNEAIYYSHHQRVYTTRESIRSFFHGQCVMDSEYYDDEVKDFKAKNPLLLIAGGCFMNLLLVIVSLLAIYGRFRAGMTAIDYLKVCIYILILITNAYLFVYNWFGKDPTNDGNTFRLIWRDKRQAQLYAQVNVMTRLICWRLSYGDMADGIFEDIFDTHGLSGSLAEELDLYEFYAMAEIDPYGERVAELASKFEKRLCQGGYFAEDLRCELGIASMIRHFANNDRRIDDTSGLNTHSTADRELLKNLLFRSVYDEGPKTEEELRDKISDCKWSSRSIIHYGQWRSVLRTFLKVREGYIEVNKKDSKEKDETVEEG